MFQDINELSENYAYLKAVTEKTTPDINLIKSFPKYTELKSLESHLKSQGLISFNTIFHEPSGNYLYKCFLRSDYSLPKAIFIDDIEVYRSMRDPGARYQISKIIFERFIAPENINNIGMTSISVFDRKSEIKKDENEFLEPSFPEHFNMEHGKGMSSTEIAKVSLDLMGGENTNAIGVFSSSIDTVNKKIQNRDTPQTLFDEIFNIVLGDLRLDVFPRFLASEFYRITKYYEQLNVGPDDFQIYRVLGRGAFGLVSACKKTNCGKLYALKCISKRKAKPHINTILNERQALSMCDSNFVVCLKYCYQDKDYLNFILDIMMGGDLKYHLNNEDSFTEEKTRFYAAEILLGLEHMHKNNIIYRDLKPENILLDSDGHCKISDLGLAVISKSKIKGYAGTPGYVAPEVCMRMAYNSSADIFSYGVVLYRFLTGRKPFRGKKGSELDKSVIEHYPTYPDHLSHEVVDLLKGLLEKDPERRFSIKEIKSHPWFQSMDWGMLEAGYIDPPFIPPKDTINAESIRDIGIDDENQLKKVKLSDSFQRSLSSFNFISVVALQREIVEVLSEFYKNRVFEKFSPEPVVEKKCCNLL